MKRYSGIDERVLTNVLNVAEGETISRARARYPVIDIPAADFDRVLITHGIRELTNRKTRGKYYMVKEIRDALKKLCLERGIRPKLNPEKLRESA